MFKYTKSAVKDSFDLIKRLIFVFQLLIQFLYLGYLAYRIVDNIGNLIFNIILTAVSIIYLIYYIITNDEFYTRKQVIVRKRVKRIFKAIKYIINIWVITLSVSSFINGNTHNDNLSLLILILMIIGTLFSIIFDIVIMLIDNQIYIIESSLKYDMEIFRTNKGVSTKLLKTVVKIDLEEMFPELEDYKIKNKIIDINHKQEQKNDRKADFQRKHK